MKIVVLSDTHKEYSMFPKILQAIDGAEMLIHLGDNTQDVKVLKKDYKGKIINVRGNCDIISKAPLEIIENIEGKKMFMTHGHEYNVKSNLLALKLRAQEIGAEVVLFGHTHACGVLYEDGIWFINPGSTAFPREGLPTLVMLEIQGAKLDATIVKL